MFGLSVVVTVISSPIEVRPTTLKPQNVAGLNHFLWLTSATEERLCKRRVISGIRTHLIRLYHLHILDLHHVTFQERLIVGYLKTMQREQLAQGDRQPRMDEVERLLYETKAFTLASHFFWALWSVVNASISTIPFDYWEYGEARFDAYFKHKSALLGHGDWAQHNTIAARFAKAL